MLNIDIVDMGLHEDWSKLRSNESSFNTNTFASFDDCRIVETMRGCVNATIEGAFAAGSLTTITVATTSLDFTLVDSIYFSHYSSLFTTVTMVVQR